MNPTSHKLGRLCLQQIARSSEPEIVMAAVRVLASRKPPGAAEALLAFLPNAADALLSEEVREALTVVAFRGDDLDPVLPRALEDRDPIKRGAAAEALCRAGASATFPAVRRLFPQPDANSDSAVLFQSAPGIQGTGEKLTLQRFSPLGKAVEGKVEADGDGRPEPLTDCVLVPEKEFFALAKLTRWVIYGTPSDEFKKANADFHPIYMTSFNGFVR